MYLSLGKRIALRFARGFAAGAVGAMASVTVADASTWADLGGVLMNLVFALFSGGLSGGILAVDKWLREKQKDL